MISRVLVSIVTPSYNQAQYLQENLLSVAEQVGPEFEIEHLVMDGGSTDETISLLQKSPNLTWVSERDRGQSDAINKGFRRATGSIIGWINSDDYYMPGAVAKIVQYFADNPDAMWVYGNCYVVDSDSRIIDSYDTSHFHLGKLINRKNFVPQQSVFFRRELLEQVGYLDESLHLSMDYDYWIRFGRVAKGHFIREYLACFRRHSDTKTSTQAARHWSEALQVSRRHGGRRFSILYIRTIVHRVYRRLPPCFHKVVMMPSVRFIVRWVR